MSDTRTGRLPTLLRFLGVMAIAGAAAFAWLRTDETLRPGEEWFDLRSPTGLWQLTRDSGDPVKISDERWQPILESFRDYDVFAEVEVAEGAELDLLLHYVYPRADGQRNVPFHARFSVLRITTVGEGGKPILTREEALFDGEDPFVRGSHGLKADGGLRQTLEIEARGRRLRARVGGREWSDWHAAVDDAGALVFVARGGASAIHSLSVQVQADHGEDLGLALAGLAALLILGYLAMRRVPVVVPWLVAAAGFFGAQAVGGWFAELLLERVRADGQFSIVAVAAPFLAAILIGHGTLLLLEKKIGFFVVEAGLGLLFAAAMLEVGLRDELPRLKVGEDPRMHAWFENDSGQAGTAAAEALARRIHPRLSGIVTADPNRPRVILLGGSMAWEEADLQFSVAPHLIGPLRGRFGPATDVAPLPGFPGSALQQIRVYERFYREPKPRAIVLALHEAELLPDPRGALLPRFQAESETSGWTLADCLADPEANAAPPVTVDQLTYEVAAFAVRCAEQEIPLVIALFPRVEDALAKSVLERLLEKGTGAPVLQLSSSDPMQLAQRIRDAVLAATSGR